MSSLFDPKGMQTFAPQQYSTQDVLLFVYEYEDC